MLKTQGDNPSSQRPGQTTASHGAMGFSSNYPTQAPFAQSSKRRHLHPQFSCEHCDKVYSTQYHLEAHQRGSCKTSKRKISDLLATTREFWEARKRRRLEQAAVPPIGPRDEQLVQGATVREDFRLAGQVQPPKVVLMRPFALGERPANSG
jgi:hypothetical protein